MRLPATRRGFSLKEDDGAALACEGRRRRVGPRGASSLLSRLLVERARFRSALEAARGLLSLLGASSLGRVFFRFLFLSVSGWLVVVGKTS